MSVSLVPLLSRELEQLSIKVILSIMIGLHGFLLHSSGSRSRGGILVLEQVELLGHDDIFLVLLQLLPCQVQIHRRHDLVPIVVREQLSLSLG